MFLFRGLLLLQLGLVVLRLVLYEQCGIIVDYGPIEVGMTVVSLVLAIFGVESVDKGLVSVRLARNVTVDVGIGAFFVAQPDHSITSLRSFSPFHAS